MYGISNFGMPQNTRNYLSQQQRAYTQQEREMQVLAKKQEAERLRQLRLHEQTQNHIQREMIKQQKGFMREYNKEVKSYEREYEKQRKDYESNLKKTDIYPIISNAIGVPIEMLNFSEIKEEPKIWKHACLQYRDILVLPPVYINYNLYDIKFTFCTFCRKVTYHANKREGVFY